MNLAYGSSYSNGLSMSLGNSTANSIGTERPGVGMMWLFPGPGSVIQPLCNRF